MGRSIDLEELIDAGEVADLCGLSGRKAVAASLSKPVGWWQEFPAPVIDRPPSRFWLRSEVRAWDEERKRNPRKRGPKAATDGPPA